jgi:ADP-ribose pyrophosphatase YjhB (NUDIX family)
MPISEYVTRLRACVGHERLLLSAAAACIRDDQDRVLVLRRQGEQELWSVPGGSMDPGERLDEAVVREVREETGLEVVPVALIGVYSAPEYAFVYPNGDLVQPVTAFFECRIVGGTLVPDMEEIVEARWVGAGDPLPPLLKCCEAKVRDAFAFRGEAFFR